jgi:hypothetical protein
MGRGWAKRKKEEECFKDSNGQSWKKKRGEGGREVGWRREKQVSVKWKKNRKRKGKKGRGGDEREDYRSGKRKRGKGGNESWEEKERRERNVWGTGINKKGKEREEGKGEGKIRREERGMYEGLELTKRVKKERVGEREKGR